MLFRSSRIFGYATASPANPFWIGLSGTGSDASRVAIAIEGDSSTTGAVTGIKFNLTPTAPTAAVGDNSTKLATTAFVQNLLPATYFYYASCTGNPSSQTGTITHNNPSLSDTNYAVFSSIYYGYSGSGGTYDATNSSGAIKTVIIHNITSTSFSWVFQREIGRAHV